MGNDLSKIEKEIGKKGKIKKFTEKKEDALITYADTTKLDKIIGKFKKTDVENGIKKYINWYKIFYKLDQK